MTVFTIICERWYTQKQKRRNSNRSIMWQQRYWRNVTWITKLFRKKYAGSEEYTPLATALIIWGLWTNAKPPKGDNATII